MGFQYSITQRSQFVTLYYQYGSSAEAAREFGRLNPGIPVPTKPTILTAVRRHEVIGSQSNRKRALVKRATTEENVTNILAAIETNPHSSLRGLSAQSGLSHMTIHRILNEYKYHPYKVQLVHRLLPTDYGRRINFCETILEKSLEDATFLERICFGDEATFYLNGTFNHHNMRLWSTSNPHWVLEKKFQETPKVNVWCGIFGNRVVGPFFFDTNINANK